MSPEKVNIPLPYIIDAYNSTCKKLNLLRTLDEDTRVFSFYTFAPLAQTALSGNSSLH